MLSDAMERSMERRTNSLGRVLAVDGRRDLIMPSVVSLTRAGYSCAVVLPGAHVVEAARWLHWDVLLFGTRGNAESALSLLRRVRTVNDAPAVLMAWDPLEMPPSERSKLRVVDVLRKPADNQALLRAIEDALTLKQAPQWLAQRAPYAQV
jgi:DNA-binding NtrC family response regulator